MRVRALGYGVMTVRGSDATRFITIALYGDLTPAGDLPRALAVIEMLAGRIYLVTVVALIVTNLSGQRQRAN